MICQIFVATIILLSVGFYSVKEDDENMSKEKGASIISNLCFSWLSSMVDLGNSRPIEISDIWNLVEEETSEWVLKEYEPIR